MMEMSENKQELSIACKVGPVNVHEGSFERNAKKPTHTPIHRNSMNHFTWNMWQFTIR